MDPRKAIRPTTLVSFSGIDGAGKSTQIDALCTFAKQAGLRVRQVRFWDDVAKLTGLRESTGHKLFKGDKGVGSPDAPITRRDKNVRSGFMSCVRLFLYFVDAVSLRNVIKRALNSDADLIVFDRYIYDELANLRLSNPLMRIYVRLMASLAPKPHISYLLNADPAQARARKPEYPLEFLYINRQSYLDLNELLRCFTIVPPMPVDDVKRAVLMEAIKVLPDGTASAQKRSEQASEIGALEINARP
jgi:thymidylate kinase